MENDDRFWLCLHAGRLQSRQGALSGEVLWASWMEAVVNLEVAPLAVTLIWAARVCFARTRAARSLSTGILEPSGARRKPDNDCDTVRRRSAIARRTGAGSRNGSESKPHYNSIGFDTENLESDLEIVEGSSAAGRFSLEVDVPLGGETAPSLGESKDLDCSQFVQVSRQAGVETMMVLPLDEISTKDFHCDTTTANSTTIDQIQINQHPSQPLGHPASHQPHPAPTPPRANTTNPEARKSKTTTTQISQHQFQRQRGISPEPPSSRRVMGPKGALPNIPPTKRIDNRKERQNPNHPRSRVYHEQSARIFSPSAPLRQATDDSISSEPGKLGVPRRNTQPKATSNAEQQNEEAPYGDLIFATGAMRGLGVSKEATAAKDYPGYLNRQPKDKDDGDDGNAKP
ncbi:hypothetical protein M409DRAFT_22142 [Zasmidium cellare ATCC 36951]|uniref:Uncharacterized protein n=1 Tax=Zasmidium cellare ATCC 36951 TaxID=1080233 RepID=A0A6A6CN41_ZASCE|nr:uncharacterized protein M409DRAFT_22142 [Zasmidium cellare ATCC 36951]KAF2167332.1 hypothetical protein M409DRAFT_22142 [Zasmidium cellare ATCC 36951]